jgi:hypothetical protein
MLRQLKLILTCTAAVAVTSLAIATTASAAGASSRSVYRFAVVANTAVSPSGGMMGAAGDWISVTGAGSFNVTARTVTAGGVFTHHGANGAVVCRGAWWGTGFRSFLNFGTDPRGRVGGVLSIVVSHYCVTMGMTMTDIPMTVTSTVNAPAGQVEGTTVADFTQPMRGSVTVW